jgi:Bax protein
MMLDLLRHPKLPWLARAGLVGAIAAFTFTTLAQYRQSSSIIDDFYGQSDITDARDTALPDFESLGDVDARKEAFFEFLTGYVESENARVAETRSRLTPLWEVVRRDYPLTDVEAADLEQIAAEYGLGDSGLSQKALARELMRRVDVIPTSLVLAQAANESAWGMSRFAREGNNIFGQWCFDAGCGLVPARRLRNATHEVRAFDSIDESVRAYFINLNTHRSYEDMRELREKMRQQGRPLDSMVLARGLTRYSERGQAYVSELQDIIRINRLGALDRS